MKEKIFISYDQQADVMYLSFAEHVKAYGREISDGVFARYNPENEELVGLTIVNFCQRFDREPRAIGIPVAK